MQTLQGIAVSPGVAIGEALVIDTEGFRIPRHFVTRDDVGHELRRLQDAVDTVAAQIERNRDAISQEIGPQYGAIFAAHLQMLRDERLQAELQALIRDHHYSAEYAVSRTLRRYAKAFEHLEGSYLGERAHDIFDLEKSLLRNLLGQRREDLAHLSAPVIVLTHSLTPSETAALDRRHVQGFVTEIGGVGGHTAIVAKALEIPAVVGTGDFLADVSSGDLVIIDGDTGVVILQPTEEVIDRYRRELEEHRTLAARLDTLRDLPAETTDGERVYLYANIEFPHEVESCLYRCADGVGLYRTEFLYLAADSEPSEQDHYAAYAQVAQAMYPRPVVIRTLDLGADKISRTPFGELERNPFLGLRSIRLSLRNRPLFQTQLRAVLKASVHGDVRVMFPLITTLNELRQAKAELAAAMQSLEQEEIEFNRDIPVGMMVETPAAVMLLDWFLNEVDFVSIGTNDLTQYALAVDRSNKEVAGLYHDSDPAVLRLIDQSLRAAASAGVTATVCGQLSASPRYAILLLGLGLRNFSTPPSAIPEIKRVCRSVDTQYCRRVAQAVLEMDDADRIDRYLHEELRKAAPELAPA